MENSINTSTTALGIAGLLSNLGCKYLPLELHEGASDALKHPLSRKLIMVSSVFLITKNIKLSFAVVSLFSIIVMAINYLTEKYKNKQNHSY